MNLSQTSLNTYVLMIFIFFALPLHADIEFSDFLFPLKKASYFGWKGFKDEMPNLYKKARIDILPNGDTLFYEKNGNMAMRLTIEATLNTDKTSRMVSMGFHFQSHAFKIQINTEGHDLILPEREALRQGQLPFYPDSENELVTQMDYFQGQTINFSIHIKKESPHFLHALFYSNSADPFIEYEEINQPTYREFIYRLQSKELFGSQKSLKVTKTQGVAMVLGTEEYFIDDLPVTAQAYLQEFEGNKNQGFGLRAFIFEMWQAGFQQMIQSMDF